MLLVPGVQRVGFRSRGCDDQNEDSFASKIASRGIQCKRVLPTPVRRKNPSRNSRAIRQPFLSMCACEPWFLTEHYPEMEAEGHDDGVEPKRTGSKGQSPTGQNKDDRDVHGISRYPVQPDTHQALGRRPRRQATAAGDVEVSNAPEKQERPNTQQGNAGHVERSSCWAQPPGNKKGDRSRKDEKGCQRAKE